jgi:hypothetical protein
MQRTGHKAVKSILALGVVTKPKIRHEWRILGTLGTVFALSSSSLIRLIANLSVHCHFLGRNLPISPEPVHGKPQPQTPFVVK